MENWIKRIIEQQEREEQRTTELEVRARVEETGGVAGSIAIAMLAAPLIPTLLIIIIMKMNSLFYAMEKAWLSETGMFETTPEFVNEEDALSAAEKSRRLTPAS